MLKTLAASLVLLWPSLSAAQGTLVVFEQPEASAVGRNFAAEVRPELAALADELGAEFRSVDAGDGAVPASVGITPLIVFQDAGGRAVYQGRYRTLDRVRNFISTARVMPQGGASLERRGLLVKRLPRSLVGAPVKVTALGGEPPDGFDAGAFEQGVRAGLAAGMGGGWSVADRVTLDRDDRLFYVDVHPYRDAAGTLSLALEVYSQFHCHDPVWSGLAEPITGPWAERDRLLRAAGARVVEAIEAAVASPALGDGFDAVGAPAAAVGFAALGLTLPEGPASAGGAGAAESFAWPKGWTLDPAASSVRFAFPAPLDGYSGEAAEVSGTLTLGAAGGFGGAGGRVDADPASVTMGEPDLDSWLRGSALKVGENPRAWFDIASVSSTDAAVDGVRIGQVTPVVWRGTFHMMGLSVPLEVPVSVEAYVGAEGAPRLRCEAQWTLGIAEPFGLDGPPGPEEASSTLRFVGVFEFIAQ